MNLITMIYVLWMYGVRLGKDLWKEAHNNKNVKKESDIKNGTEIVLI